MSRTELMCRNIYKWKWDLMSEAQKARCAAAIRRINAEFSGATAKGAKCAEVRVRQERSIKNLKNAAAL